MTITISLLARSQSEGMIAAAARLRPYAPNGSGGIEVHGECRDVTDHLGNRDTINTPLPPDALA